MFDLTGNDKITVITHNDSDGLFCGYIIKRKYPQAKVFTTNYGKEIPKYMIDDCDLLFVTDFSFNSLSELQQLAANPTRKFVWIDHHQVINEASKIGFNPEGLRSTECSAAKLTWKYLYPNEECPKVIQLVSDYDIWNWKENIEALYFHYGSGSLELKPIGSEKCTRVFNELIKPNSKLLEVAISNGKQIHEYIQFHNRIVIEDGMFETELGGYKAIACNIKNTNSLLFESVEEKYKDFPLRILFGYFANIDQYRVSVFSVNPEVSAHDVCYKFGGGGHIGAAGFSIKNLPFELPHSNENCKIDIFHELKLKLDSEPIVRYYVDSGSIPLVLSHKYASVVENYTAIVVNNPTCSIDSIYKIGDAYWYQLAVFVNMMKNGKYRYRCYVLNNELNISDVARSISGAIIIDNTICFVRDSLPSKIA